MSTKDTNTNVGEDINQIPSALKPQWKPRSLTVPRQYLNQEANHEFFSPNNRHLEDIDHVENVQGSIDENSVFSLGLESKIGVKLPRITRQRSTAFDREERARSIRSDTENAEDINFGVGVNVDSSSHYQDPLQYSDEESGTSIRRRDFIPARNVSQRDETGRQHGRRCHRRRRHRHRHTAEAEETNDNVDQSLPSLQYSDEEADTSIRQHDFIPFRNVSYRDNDGRDHNYHRRHRHRRHHSRHRSNHQRRHHHRQRHPDYDNSRRRDINISPSRREIIGEENVAPNTGRLFYLFLNII